MNIQTRQLRLGPRGRLLAVACAVVLCGCASGITTLSKDARLEQKIAEQVKNDPFPSNNMSTSVANP